MSRFLKEPLFHFLVLGALLFALFTWLDDGATQAPNEIVVDEDRVDSLLARFERTWQRPPTPVEARSLVESWIRDEVFYREGLALGLDQGDEVVRRRITQKMRFLSESLATPEPSEADLSSWLAEHADRYRVEPVYTLQQAWFDPQRHGGDAGARAAAAAALGAPEPPVAGDSASLLPDALEDAPRREVARSFGEVFADALPDLPVGEWSGPVRSGYGWHAVRVERRTPGRLPALDEVREAVTRDWVSARQDQALDALYDELRARYTVRWDEALGTGAEDAPAAGDGNAP